MGLKEELATIYTEHGELTPRLIIDAARPTRHPLHARYEWDNKEAGEAWRLHQAQADIRSVRVRYETPDGTEELVRKYTSVAGPSGFAYREMEEVAVDPLLSEIVLRDANRAWRDLFKRYGHLQAFIESVRASIAANAGKVA